MNAKTIKNMEEFANLSQISRPTLSKYFQDPDSVRKSTRAKIEEALEKYNYRPNIYAMNQNRRLTKNVGIIVPYLADPFFAEIARIIQNMVIDAGYRPILMSSNGDPEQEMGNLDSLRQIRPAGVLIAMLGRASNAEYIQEFCNDIPTVLFDSTVDEVGDYFIGHDNIQATSVIIDYLMRTGEAPVFFEMLRPANPNANKRRNAYLQAMETMGLEPHIISVEGDGWEFEDIGYREGLRVLSERALSTNTVLCSNDRLAIGFLAAAYESGMRVGRNPGCALRVAGHDNHPFSRFTCPSLTTISHDYNSIAQKSVETLFSFIDSQDRPQARQVTLFNGQLIMRSSA